MNAKLPLSSVNNSLKLLVYFLTSLAIENTGQSPFTSAQVIFLCKSNLINIPAADFEYSIDILSNTF